MSALDCKQVLVQDLSVHLMKDIHLSNHEYLKPGTFDAQLAQLRFPYDYPLLNHPSTIALLKGDRAAVTVKFNFAA